MYKIDARTWFGTMYSQAALFPSQIVLVFNPGTSEFTPSGGSTSQNFTPNVITNLEVANCDLRC